MEEQILGLQVTDPQQNSTIIVPMRESMLVGNTVEGEFQVTISHFQLWYVDAMAF